MLWIPQIVWSYSDIWSDESIREIQNNQVNIMFILSWLFYILYSFDKLPLFQNKVLMNRFKRLHFFFLPIVYTYNIKLVYNLDISRHLLTYNSDYNIEKVITIPEW